jgi:hypothetical protein
VFQIQIDVLNVIPHIGIKKGERKMAQRRMFSLQIVDTDAFLDMPQTAQLLYFHLSMRADDDGFVGNPRKIMRMTGVNEDDIKILLAKRFILSFDSGIIVIKHWKIHNYIQKDRYNETKYLEEKAKLKLKDNGVYTECIQSVNTMDTQVRLGKSKVRLGKVSIIENTPITEQDLQEISDKYKVTLSMVKLAKEEMDNWLEAKGKRYKNYKAGLRNWVLRDAKKVMEGRANGRSRVSIDINKI